MRDDLGSDQDREGPKRLEFRQVNFLRKVRFQFSDFGFDSRRGGLQVALADACAPTFLQGLDLISGKLSPFQAFR